MRVARVPHTPFQAVSSSRQCPHHSAPVRVTLGTQTRSERCEGTCQSTSVRRDCGNVPPSQALRRPTTFADSPLPATSHNSR